MHSNVLQCGFKPVKRPRSKFALGFDPDAPWVCYSRHSRFTFLPRPLADEFDNVLGYRSVGVHQIFGVEELDLVRTRVALFGLVFGTVDDFAVGLKHVTREGDVIDDVSGRRAA